MRRARRQSAGARILGSWGRRKRGQARRLALESLEDRRLLAAVWRNPTDPLDVNDDSFIAPIDVLQVINELNETGSRQLSDIRDPSKPYWDTNGDQFIAPIDALLVINALNTNLIAPYTLVEATQFARDFSVAITLGQPAGARHYRMEISPRFDKSD